MLFKSNLKDHIGILFYRHGLFCASHPVPLLCLVFSVLFLCCYPLINLPPLGDSVEQFTQADKTFDGLDAQILLDQKFQYSKLPDKPPWYNRVPVAYIQQIIIKSNIETIIENDNSYLIDKYRTPLAYLFEINDFIRNFHYHKLDVNNKTITKSLNDLCLHVDNLKKVNTDNENLNEDTLKINSKNSNLNLPEFSCLYISPSNYWSNSKLLFKNDDNILNTINLNDYYLLNLNKNEQVKLRDILFGIKWSDFMQTYNFNQTTLSTFAITIAFKNYDAEFINELKIKLYEKFQSNLIDNRILKSSSLASQATNFIHLQYTSKSFWYYIPYISLYILLFLYIYISVSKIEFVKSKWGLALAAVAQVIASLFMSVGICSFFGLQPTLNSGEIFPYLVIFIGFENIVVLTKSVVSTPADLDVRYRIALGLQKESWKITKNLTFELIIIFIGILTMVPAIQEFCAFAYVGLLIDFFMQMIFFVTVLSIDIRRMELSDLNRIKQDKILNDKLNNCSSLNHDHDEDDVNDYKQLNDNFNFNLKNRKKSPLLSSSASLPSNLKAQNSIKNKKKFKNLHLNSNNSTVTNKSLQIFYFWARTRIVQRAIMLLCLFWFALIFYKSLLVVELLRYDVNISKETVDALLPKPGVGFANLFMSQIKNNFYQFISSSSTTPTTLNTPITTHLSTKFNEFLTNSDFNTNINNNIEDFLTKNENENFNDSDDSNFIKKLNIYNSLFFNNENWKRLSYHHWLNLFSYYNITIYNRYITILPQINLYTSVSAEKILQERNLNEIEKYKLTKSFYQNKNNSSSHTSNSQSSSIKLALFELLMIVIFGIPVIITFLYSLTLLYKCLCSKKYEQWRRSWSTSTIKRQYYHIHKRCYNLSTNTNDDDEEDDDDDDNENIDDDTNITDDRKNKFYDNEQNQQLIDISNHLVKINQFRINDGNQYPIDLIAYTDRLCATSDLNNEIFIWSLNRETIGEYINKINISQQMQQQDEQVSIWSICFITDEILAIGLSNGQILAYNYQSKIPSCMLIISNHDRDNNNGVTHIIKLKTQEEDLSILFLITRLNGYLEQIELELNSDLIKTYKLKVHKQIRAHLNAITFLCYEYDYILTSNSQEQSIKVFKQDALNCIYKLNNPFEQDQLTALTISKYNSTIAVSGYKNGVICVWNLLNGNCKYKLNSNSKIKQTKPSILNYSIIKLELTTNLIIGLNRMQQISIWNLLNGQLINEFQLNVNFFNLQITHMCLYKENYLITSNIDCEKHKSSSISIWCLNEISIKNDNASVLRKKFTLNSNRLNTIRSLNTFKLASYNDCLIIHDSSDLVYLLELKNNFKLN